VTGLSPTERLGLKRLIDSATRERVGDTIGPPADTEPPHSGCSLHAEAVVRMEQRWPCAPDEQEHPAALVMLGASLAVVNHVGGGLPMPSRLWGDA
jgi:hypothetical protein